MSTFSELCKLNVNDKTEKKGNLTYLSWSWAWQIFKEKYPDATYTIYKNENGLPYVFDPNTGYMVYTTVTADGITHEMWLPVMDGANRAMKAEPYKVYNKTVEAANMFDVNKAIMRCLTKNLAMFGLGLYIYSGEDLPEISDEEQKEQSAKDEKKKKELLYGMDFLFIELSKKLDKDVEYVKQKTKERFNVTGEIENLTAEQVEIVYNKLAEWVQKVNENTGAN